MRDTAEALAKADRHGLEILPLYGRLSSAEQHRIFEAHTRRRAVLATNVAETSLTVPGVRYVVDTGTARISRYSRRTKVQRLPIEAISQASANQRAGRCGRLGPGICVRLYSEEDFNARRPFTEPEVLRTNLASVVLQMAAIGLGEIEDFPFVDPPDRRNVKDGIVLLEELGALSPMGAASRGRPGAATIGDRPGGLAAHRGRAAAGPAASGSPPRTYGAGGGPARVPGRGAGDRRRAFGPGPPRTPGRKKGGRRRTARPF